MLNQGRTGTGQTANLDDCVLKMRNLYTHTEDARQRLVFNHMARNYEILEGSLKQIIDRQQSSLTVLTSNTSLQ